MTQNLGSLISIKVHQKDTYLQMLHRMENSSHTEHHPLMPHEPRARHVRISSSRENSFDPRGLSHPYSLIPIPIWFRSSLSVMLT